MLSSGVDVDLHGGAAAVERSRTDRLQSMLGRHGVGETLRYRSLKRLCDQEGLMELPPKSQFGP